MGKGIWGKLFGLLGLAAATYGASKFIQNREPSRYSTEWISGLSDSQWAEEREIVRQKYCSRDYDMNAKIGFQKILGLFDKVKSDRDWAGETPRGPAYHREHGYNLYKDD